MKQLDLIDRNVLLEKAYCTHPATMANPYGGEYVVSEEDIENAPSIDAKPVIHSMWTFNRDGSGTCQNCHRTTRGVYDQDSWYRYCPDCGARMDGGV